MLPKNILQKQLLNVLLRNIFYQFFIFIYSIFLPIQCLNQQELFEFLHCTELGTAFIGKQTK